MQVFLAQRWLAVFRQNSHDAEVDSGPGSITRLVNQMSSRTEHDSGDAVAVIYAALTAMARDRVRRLGPDREIRTGDLVHEAYLKLFARPADHPWESRSHFFGSAARAMQQVIVDLVRRSEVRRVHGPSLAVSEIALPQPFSSHGIEQLHLALEELDRVDPQAAEVVRVRFFVGLGMEETARVLGLPLRSAQRKWTLARAWLFERMSR
jgi:RNA polymerase sigma factor (TIGR02999 family)